MLAFPHHNNDDQTPASSHDADCLLRNSADPVHDDELHRVLRLDDFEVPRWHRGHRLRSEGQPVHRVPGAATLFRWRLQCDRVRVLQCQQLRWLLRRQRYLPHGNRQRAVREKWHRMRGVLPGTDLQADRDLRLKSVCRHRQHALTNELVQQLERVDFLLT